MAALEDTMLGMDYGYEPEKPDKKKMLRKMLMESASGAQADANEQGAPVGHFDYVAGLRPRVMREIANLGQEQGAPGPTGGAGAAGGTGAAWTPGGENEAEQQRILGLTTNPLAIGNPAREVARGVGSAGRATAPAPAPRLAFDMLTGRAYADTPNGREVIRRAQEAAHLSHGPAPLGPGGQVGPDIPMAEGDTHGARDAAGWRAAHAAPAGEAQTGANAGFSDMAGEQGGHIVWDPEHDMGGGRKGGWVYHGAPKPDFTPTASTPSPSPAFDATMASVAPARPTTVGGAADAQDVIGPSIPSSGPTEADWHPAGPLPHPLAGEQAGPVSPPPRGQVITGPAATNAINADFPQAAPGARPASSANGRLDSFTRALDALDSTAVSESGGRRVQYTPEQQRLHRQLLSPANVSRVLGPMIANAKTPEELLQAEALLGRAHRANQVAQGAAAQPARGPRRGRGQAAAAPQVSPQLADLADQIEKKRHDLERQGTMDWHQRQLDTQVARDEARAGSAAERETAKEHASELQHQESMALQRQIHNIPDPKIQGAADILKGLPATDPRRQAAILRARGGEQNAQTALDLAGIPWK